MQELSFHFLQSSCVIDEKKMVMKSVVVLVKEKSLLNFPTQV